MLFSNYQRAIVSASIGTAIAALATTACSPRVAPGAAPRPAARLAARTGSPEDGPTPAKPRMAVAGAEATLYPLAAGLRWDYVLRQRQNDGTIKERPMAMGVARAAEIAPGVVEAVIERGYQGWAPPATRARATAERVVLNRLADPAPPEGPSLTILELPATAGARWPGRPLAGGHHETVVAKGEEDVVVPAGAYRAVHVVHELRYANGDGDDLEYWYAPGAGCVRMIERTTVEVGGTPMKLAVEGVLTKLTPDAWPAGPAPAPSAAPTIRLMPERLR